MKTLILVGFLLTMRLIDIDYRYWLIRDDGQVLEIQIEDTEVV